MTTKNGKLTQQEKAFWKEAFIAALRTQKSTDVNAAADLADAALAVYRERIIWRKQQ